jgi:putative endopeptidase
MFSLAGEDFATAAASAEAVLKIETALANSQMSRIQMRDPNATYNKFAVKDLGITPNIDWAMMLRDSKIMGADSLLVNNPGFMKKVNEMLVTVPVEDWRSYLRWNLIKSAAPYLSSDFVKADFEFTRVQTGQREQTPRWQRMSGMIDRMLGDMVGRTVCKKIFQTRSQRIHGEDGR